MARPGNADTVNGVFNLNSLLEDLPQANSASAPSTPFPDGISKPPIGRGLHAHHASLSSTSFSAFHNAAAAAAAAASPNMGGARQASVFDYADQPRSAYRMPRVINTSVFNGQIRRGRCKFFNSQKGFGFINDAKPEDLDNVEVFVHFTAIASNGGFRSLGENEECEYTLVPGPKGYQASNVTGPGGRPVVGDPKARAPMAKQTPPYMFVPPHGAHFYDPYHAASSYYPHSPYGQVMLSIVPTQPGAHYSMAHPAYAQHSAVPAAPSPYGAPATVPPVSASPPVAATSPQYLYSGSMAAGQPPIAAAARTSPFNSSVAVPYSGLGLGQHAAARTPWQAPSGLGAIGGQRISSVPEGGRFGSPSLPTTGTEPSPSINASTLSSDIFSNGVVSPAPTTTTNASIGTHVKRSSTSQASGGTSSFGEGGGVHGRRGSTAQELFDNAGTAPSVKPAPHPRNSGGGLSSAANSLLYPSTK